MANHNPFLIVFLGDFNVKSENWYKHDKASYKGAKIDVLTTQFRLQQIIKKPIHVLAESFFCIDLISTSHQSLIMESEVHSSIHPNCYYQLTYAKFSLKIHYPPPYKCEIWHYEQVNVDHIRKAVDLFSWEKTLRNLNINNMIFLFNKTVKNIISNYISHETVTFEDRDRPWINKKVKQLILEKMKCIKDMLKKTKTPKYFTKLNVPKTN